MSIIFSLANLRRTTKRALQIIADIILIIACFSCAMFLRLDSWYFVNNHEVWLVLGPVIPATIIMFAGLGLYRIVVRYISYRILRAFFTGIVFSALIMSSSAYLLDLPIPRSVPGIYAMLLFITSSGVRFIVQGLFRNRQHREKTPVVIYGAGEAGRQLSSALDSGDEYSAVAFVDDDKQLQGSIIGGLRVYAPKAISKVIEKKNARVVLLALPRTDRARRSEIILSLEPLELKIMTIPRIADIVSGNAKFSDLRAVTPEDLLGRDVVAPRDDLMKKNIKGKAVMVSGAGGSIGSELCRQIIKHKPERLILFEISEFGLYTIEGELREFARLNGLNVELAPILGSVQSKEHTDRVIAEFGIQTIFHAAAYKHVPLVEENVVASVYNNIFGTQTIAEAAIRNDVENFILISTDKAVRPTNVMGASKRMAELICQVLAEKKSQTTFSMVRFGNVLGSSGSVVPRFQSQIENGGPITVTHREINRYFMTIAEAAQLVIQASSMAKGGDVFVLDMGKPVKIIDLAQSMVRLNGMTPYIIEQYEDIDEARGDIAICITGLRKGEKLYEELLIGNASAKTDHPRIMTASEVMIESRELKKILDKLQQACTNQNIPVIRKILLEAPLSYQPTNDEIVDVMWSQAQPGKLATTLH